MKTQIWEGPGTGGGFRIWPYMKSTLDMINDTYVELIKDATISDTNVTSVASNTYHAQHVSSYNTSSKCVMRFEASGLK